MPAGIAKGNHHVPATGGQVLGQCRRPLGVIKDQKPPVPFPQRPHQAAHRRAYRIGDGRQTKRMGQLGEPIGHQRRLLRWNPPHQVVLGPIAVGVLNGQRGLADPAHPVQSLHHSRRTLVLQGGMQRGEQLFPPGEHRATRGHIPHPLRQCRPRPGSRELCQGLRQHLTQLLRCRDRRCGHSAGAQPGPKGLLSRAVAQIDEQILRALGVLTEQ
jgi:hypothetical protein